MCEFCLKHGEGKKWYLQAKNYSDDLPADLRRAGTVSKDSHKLTFHELYHPGSFAR